MADSDALRARRRRRHASGDHSLCIPGRCQALESPDAPSEVYRAGARLLSEISESLSKMSPLHRQLAIQLGRTVDRLESLDRQLAGQDWLRFRHDETGTEVTVYVDRVLAEEREQAMAMMRLATELEKGLPKPKQEAKGGSKLASITALLEAKRPPAS